MILDKKWGTRIIITIFHVLIRIEMFKESNFAVEKKQPLVAI